MKEAFKKIKEKLEEERHPEIYGGWETLKIDRAIEIVNQVEEEYGKSKQVNKHLDSLHEKILKSKFAEEVTEAEIDALVKAKSECNSSRLNNGWIPCSERLPEPNTLVLVSTDAGKIDTDYYGAYLKGFIGLKGTGQKAIAWRPLPAPYKGE